MLKHYLTLAFRNLQKYRLQTVVSILGLAAGFICLSLSALWERYENTFNTSIPHADRMCMTYAPDLKSFSSPGGFLQKAEQMPEVEAFATIEFSERDLYVGEREARANVLCADRNFFKLFDIRCTNGELVGEEMGAGLDIALSRSLAHQLFGNEDPVGQQVNYKGGPGVNIRFDVKAVYEDMDPHSDIYADAIMLFYTEYKQGNWTRTVFLLQPGKAVFDSFARKADQHVEWSDTTHMRVMSFTEAHSQGHGKHGSLSREHRKAFLLISLMLTVCALANFLSFWLNRLRSRRREMALRLVHGATGRGLVAMFTTEVLLVLLAAAVVGTLGILLLGDTFAQFAHIQMEGYIFSHSLLFMGVTLAVCLLVCTVAVIIVKNVSTSRSISITHRPNHTFANVSTAIQFIISLLFIFCTLVMFRQVSQLRHRDWGIAYKNVAIFSYNGYREMGDGVFVMSGEALHGVLEEKGIPDKLRAMPGIIDVVDEGRHFISEGQSMGSLQMRLTPESQPIQSTHRRGVFHPSSPIYDFTVLEGTLPTAENWQDNEIIITESVRDQLGLTSAVGQTVEIASFFSEEWRPCTIVAVISDITFDEIFTKQDSHHITFLRPNDDERKNALSGKLMFCFEPGMRDDVARRIDEMMAAYPEMLYDVRWGEDVMAQYIQSETNLMRLLAVVTAVALLIALFGMYSIITLACHQRRKEIAVRKVHGAKVGDILGLFIKEYGLILLVSAAVAFVAGTLLMHRWLEGYLHRTPLSWWLYVGLFVGVALLIALCVGSRVWKTARENPADVVKSEN